MPLAKAGKVDDRRANAPIRKPGDLPAETYDGRTGCAATGFFGAACFQARYRLRAPCLPDTKGREWARR